MRRPLIPLLTTALVALLSVSVPVAVRPAGAAVSDRVTLVGLTTDDKLVTFTTDGPGTFLSTVAVTGLATGEHLVDLGFRPAGAGLYGLGNTSRLYSINPTTGAATAIGPGVFTPALAGASWGIDFNLYGSAGSITLAQPIVGMATTHTGAGYWIVAADGGIFAYGDASPVGSAASRNSPSPFVGMAAV